MADTVLDQCQKLHSEVQDVFLFVSHLRLKMIFPEAFRISHT